MNRWEIYRAERTAIADRETLDALLTQSDSETLLTWAHQRATEHNQHIRIVTEGGQPVLDVDHTITSDFAFRLSELLYGPVAHGVATLEGAWGPLNLRPESTTAEVRGESARFAPGGNLLVHAVAQKHRSPTSEPLLFHVQSQSRRSVLPERVQRNQLLKLLSATLASALLIGWALNRRLLNPLERLRLEVLARAKEAVPQAGIDLGRSDELGDLADAFNTLVTALAERTKANEAFLNDLAHEMKNPVAAVRTCAELIAQGGLTAQRVEKLTGVLLQSSTQLDKLVTQFLDLARAEAGLPREPRESLPLGALLSGIQARLAADPRFFTVAWRLHGLDQAVTVLGVPALLERAFSNLLLNALSFAGEGGWVELGLEVQGATANVSVHDSGPGIEPEHLPHLFERFFTTRHEQNGTGLGLALTRAIIEAHSGRVAVTSPAGGGARFVISLPM